MGYNPGFLDLVIGWASDYQIRPGAAVLDIGTSELYCPDDPASLNRFLVNFGAKPYTDDELGCMANRGLAGDLLIRAGFNYEAIDLIPRPHTLRLDLNTDSLPFWRRGRYAFVVNAGTSEHILNQYNVFKVIHEATALGGLMYHGVPMAGEFGHGIVSYNPKFFRELARANSYEIVDFWGWAADEAFPLKEDLAPEVTFNRPLAAQDAFLHILLRRYKKGPFRALIDPAFEPL
jgi:hypothetical protein